MPTAHIMLPTVNRLTSIKRGSLTMGEASFPGLGLEWNDGYASYISFDDLMAVEQIMAALREIKEELLVKKMHPDFDVIEG